VQLNNQSFTTFKIPQRNGKLITKWFYTLKCIDVSLSFNLPAPEPRPYRRQDLPHAALARAKPRTSPEDHSSCNSGTSSYRMHHWPLDSQTPSVGSGRPSSSRRKCIPGCRVSVLEGNWRPSLLQGTPECKKKYMLLICNQNIKRCTLLVIHTCTTT